MPLLLRGARQVGKTFIVEYLGKNYFKHFVNINFELEPEYNDCFQTLKPEEIINSISALSRQSITPGETLLFFDEIQNCPKAIMALRYFKEKLPELHIIGAGSLLEFALTDENFSMPVGRVQFIYLKPLSFQEFLQAEGYDDLLKTIKTCTIKNSIPAVLHEKLLSLVKQYLIIGGMPADIQTYIDTQDYLQVERMQTIIMSTYRNDFGKYAKINKHPYLQAVFRKNAGLIGERIKYKHIESEARSRDLKQAIELLTRAGIIYPVISTAASGLPLSALSDDKKFKLLFLDVGLVTRHSGLTANDILNKEMTLVNQGALTEQFVGQELLAYQNCYDEPELYFWARDAKGSSAEVDYVLTYHSTIIPIEVKSGSTGHLKSLHSMLQEKRLPIGVRVSEQPLQKIDKIISVPFYLIGELKRLLTSSM
jgi:predicted AAA+ superfamily ATPase